MSKDALVRLERTSAMKQRNTQRFSVPLYFKYIDDVVMTILFNIKIILKRWIRLIIQFILEIRSDKINFYSNVAIINNNSLEFDWKHKFTFSEG